MGCFADDSSFWTIPSTIGKLKYDILQKELSRFTDWTKILANGINPPNVQSLNYTIREI